MDSSAKSQSPASNYPATSPLLVEIGCEEIPARFLSDAQKQFGDRLLAALGEARLWPARELLSPISGDRNPSPGIQASAREARTAEGTRVKTYSTPRRLVAFCPFVLAAQPDLIEEVTGPAVRVGFDAAGRPT